MSGAKLATLRKSQIFYFWLRLWKIIPGPVQLWQKCVKEASSCFVSAVSVFSGNLTPPTEQQERRMNTTSELSGWVTTHRIRQLRGPSQVSAWWSATPPRSLPSRSSFPDWQPVWVNEDEDVKRSERVLLSALNRPAATRRLFLMQFISQVLCLQVDRDWVAKFPSSLNVQRPKNSSLPHTEAADAPAPPVTAVANRGQDPRTTRSSKKRRTSHSAVTVMCCCHF